MNNDRRVGEWVKDDLTVTNCASELNVSRCHLTQLLACCFVQGLKRNRVWVLTFNELVDQLLNSAASMPSKTFIPPACYLRLLQAASI
jgi:hypothetical protein